MQTRRYLANYPKRGEIYIADLNPGFGREIHKKRPVLVVSNNILNQNSPFVIILPLSSLVPQLVSFELVQISRFKGLDKDSVILVDQIRAIDKTRLIKKVGKLPKEKISEVEESLKLVLGLIEI